ncbi:MAG: hypothetical protein JWN34_5719 [Bryobacterales bacterium]|nr:hypothetical protein [Bryobacterales bacterium]
MREISGTDLDPNSRPSPPPRVVTGEVIDPRLADVEAVARWLDYGFTLPGGFRYGLDGIIGLIPGLGDLVGALLSLYIVFRAWQLGIPKVTITRMVLNIGIEAGVGAVPIIGDLFDFVFKANRRNYELVRDHLSQPRRRNRLDWMFVLAVTLVMLAAIALPLWVLATLLGHLGSAPPRWSLF